MPVSGVSRNLILFSTAYMGLSIVSTATLLFQKYITIPRLEESEILKNHTYFYIQQRTFVDYVLLSIPVLNIAMIALRFFTGDPVEAKMKESLLNAVQKNPEVLTSETAEILSLTSNHDFMQSAVKNNLEALLYLKGRLKTDLDFWVGSINHNEEAISYIPLQLQESRAFWFKLIVANPKLVDRVPNDIKEKRFLLLAIQANANVYSHLNELQRDRNFLIRAFKANNGIWKLVRNEPQIYPALITLLSHDSPLFENLSYEIKNDKAFKWALIRRYPDFIRHMPNETREFYLKTVTAFPSTLRHIPEMEDMEDFILEAYKRNKSVLTYYPVTHTSHLLTLIAYDAEVLKGRFTLVMNEKFMLAAIEANPKVFEYLHWPMTENKCFMEKAQAAKHKNIDCKSVTPLI